jgi:hypothetical protein
MLAVTVEPLDGSPVLTEAVAGEHDDGRNPTHAGDIAEDRGGTGIDSGQRIAHGGRRRSSVVSRLLGAALGAIECRTHLVSALAAKRHLLLHTLFLSRVFRQPEFHVSRKIRHFSSLE